MAATYTAAFVSASLNASGVDVVGLNNGAGSGVVLRVKRVYLVNTSTTTAGTVSALAALRLYRREANTSGTTVSPVKHDTASPNLPSQVTAKAVPGFRSQPSDNIFRRCLYYNRLAAPGQMLNSELEIIIPWTCIFDASKDPDAEAIVVREGEALALYFDGVGSGTCDVFYEFTSSPT